MSIAIDVYPMTLYYMGGGENYFGDYKSEHRFQPLDSFMYT